MKLTVQNAEIKTATVEVKTLTISGKQVTLAVFRQLKLAPLVRDGDDDCSLNGVPWGTVNYHGKCRDERTHLHVVWQRGTELLHAMEFAPLYLRSGEVENAVSRAYKQRWIELNDLPQLFIAV